MALEAKLTFGSSGDSADKEYTLADYRIISRCDHSNRGVSGAPYCDQMILSLHVNDHQDMALFNWYLNDETKTGTIIVTFSKGTNEDTSGDLKKITFRDAKCFELSDHYDNTGNGQRTLTLKIAVTEICHNDIAILNGNIYGGR